MSTLKNSIFSGFVPVTEQPRPTAAKSGAQPSAVLASTGSALLDSFAADAEQKALSRQAVLTQQLTSLSFELQRINGRDANGRDANGRDINGRGTTRPAIREATGHIDKTDKTAALPTTQPIAKPKGAAQIQSQPIDSKKTGSKNPATVSAKQKAKGKRSTEKAAKNPVALNQLSTAVRQPAAQAQKSGVAVNSQSISQPIPQPIPQSIPRPQPTNPQVKVYGGSSYKALQAKAAAGGLVNLDDTLLFGGVEHKKAKGTLATQPRQLDSDFFLSYLSHPLEDFTVSPIPGGIHLTAHLSDCADIGKVSGPNRLRGRAWHRAVLDIDTFKLGDLAREARVYSAAPRVATLNSATLNSATLNSPEMAKNAAGHAVRESNAVGEPVEFSDLSQQVAYLNQRIDYLSQKLAELTPVKLPEPDQPPADMPTQPYRSQTVLATENLQLTKTTQSTEKRASTLDSSFKIGY